MSLKRVQEVHEYIKNGKFAIGSAVKVGRIASDPWMQQRYSALAAGAGLIGSVQIQNMASIGGNICNASPSADTAPPLLVLDARLLIASAQGERTLPLAEFFLGPGKTALQPGELLKAILLPNPESHSGSFYYRHTPRARMDIAVVGSAAMLVLDEKWQDCGGSHCARSGSPNPDPCPGGGDAFGGSGALRRTLCPGRIFIQGGRGSD